MRLLLIALLLCVGCVSTSKTVLDRSYIASPVPADSVRIFLPGDEVPLHVRIALLTTETAAEWTQDSDVLKTLRKQAGKLGANAIMFMGVSPNSGVWRKQRKGEAVAIRINYPSPPDTP